MMPKAHFQEDKIVITPTPTENKQDGLVIELISLHDQEAGVATYYTDIEAKKNAYVLPYGISAKDIKHVFLKID